MSQKSSIQKLIEHEIYLESRLSEYYSQRRELESKLYLCSKNINILETERKGKRNRINNILRKQKEKIES